MSVVSEVVSPVIKINPSENFGDSFKHLDNTFVFRCTVLLSMSLYSYCFFPSLYVVLFLDCVAHILLASRVNKILRAKKRIFSGRNAQ